MDPTMEQLIGGGLRPSYVDDSMRSWACGCYEDQGGYHFCAKNHAFPDALPAAAPDAGAPQEKDETK